MVRVTFTSLEADVLRHRLVYLAALDIEDLQEIFPAHDSPADLAQAADLAADLLYDGRLEVVLTHRDTLLVLVEAVEGATIHELADEATEAGAISRQKINVLDLSATADAFEITDQAALTQACQSEYTLPIFTPEGQAWKMPAGAFVTEGCGSV